MLDIGTMYLCVQEGREMKYGESFFDLAYLLFAIVTGLRILGLRRGETGRLMGTTVLILGCGDAFHLVPRVLNYFFAGDFTPWLGFGKLVTSITMTLFYLLLYRLWHRLFKVPESPSLRLGVYALTALRIVLCLLPQNRWLENESSVLWGVVRNLPFVVLGAVIVWLYWHRRREALGRVWLLVSLSFLFYIPVAVGAGVLPLLGMLMLPKTVCYILLIWDFWVYLKAPRSA